MKKWITSLLVVALMATMVAPAKAVPDGHRGGIMGFVAGCCFGIRAGMDYNDGKDLCWREWLRLVPWVGFVVAVWDGIDCANGMQRAYFAEKYGSTYY